MLKKLILTAAAGTALLSSAAFADNGWHRGWDRGWDRHHRPHGHVVVRPVFVRPAPVVVAPYYQPAPVVVAPPAPVYSYPAPVAVYPAPRVYSEPAISVRFRLPL